MNQNAHRMIGLALKRHREMVEQVQAHAAKLQADRDQARVEAAQSAAMERPDGGQPT